MFVHLLEWTPWMGRMTVVSVLQVIAGNFDNCSMEVSSDMLSSIWEVQEACYWRGTRETMWYKNSDEDIHMSSDAPVT